jgi:integrase/recombinase XerD
MKTFREAIQDYLTLRRGLGFKLKKHSRMLEEFASFLEQKGALRITSRLALQWATEPQHIQPVEWAARLSVARGFARYWSATDPLTEIPPEGLLPYRHNRAKPYLYSDGQIQQLLEAAKNMPAPHSLQPLLPKLHVRCLIEPRGERAWWQEALSSAASWRVGQVSALRFTERRCLNVR